MTPHILSLTALHAAAPGVLDVVFGPDGDFEGAPNWHPPLWDGAWAYHIGDVPDPLDGLALDLRVPSVAARLAGLCKHALEADPRRRGNPNTVREWHWEWCRAVNLYRRTGEAWTADEAADLAAMTLALAPRIAALGGTR